MTQPTANPNDESRRRGIRRTAWILAVVAAGIFVAFLLSAVIE